MKIKMSFFIIIIWRISDFEEKFFLWLANKKFVILSFIPHCSSVTIFKLKYLKRKLFIVVYNLELFCFSKMFNLLPYKRQKTIKPCIFFVVFLYNFLAGNVLGGELEFLVPNSKNNMEAIAWNASKSFQAESMFELKWFNNRGNWPSLKGIWWQRGKCYNKYNSTDFAKP